MVKWNFRIKKYINIKISKRDKFHGTGQSNLGIRFFKFHAVWYKFCRSLRKKTHMNKDVYRVTYMHIYRTV